MADAFGGSEGVLEQVEYSGLGLLGDAAWSDGLLETQSIWVFRAGVIGC